jgi:ligand-binding sensor domain-containing protein/signal transduction histidine kinase
MVLGSGFALLLLPPGIHSQDAETQPYQIESWQVEDGLPQSSVTSIVQTREGYLWLGTFNGLVRFDGMRFKVFNPNTAPGLPSGRIVQVFEDHERTLWVGAEEGLLVRYAHGGFETRAPASEHRMMGYVRGVAESEGALWMITSDRQLMRFATDQLAVVRTNLNLSGTHVAGLASDNRHQLWVCTDRGISILEQGRFKTVFEQDRAEGLDPGMLAASRRGGCWAAVNGRLRRFDEGRCAEDFGAFPWSKGDLFCMLEDRKGQLWLGTYGSGLYRYSTNGAVLHLSTRDGLPGDLIRSLCEDREGNLWVGTEGSGLARLKPAIFHAYGRREGLSDDCVLSVCEGQDGELWIGTNGDGINRLHRGTVRHYGPQQGLTNECVWSIFEDRSHTVWAGTWGGGLFQLRGERFVPLAGIGDANTVVCALYQDANGCVWAGAQDAGADILQLRDGKPDVFRLQNRQARADVRAVTTDPKGNLWLGTQEDGLYRICGSTQTHFGKKEGLNNETIRSLYADADGVLWIGTYGGGLNRFEDGHFTAFTTRDGLPSDALCYITEDGSSNLWCGSLGGIFRIKKDELNHANTTSPRTLHCLNYTTVDGLPTLECSGGCQPSGWKTRDGRLCFPTVRGLAIVNPEQVPFNTLPPPVVIEEVAMEGKDGSSGKSVFNTTEASKRIGEFAEAAAHLAIPAGNERLEFRFTGLSLVAPRKVRFEYRLEGLEKEWVEAGPRRTANYSYLRPGNYRFLVRACNNDGVWNEAGAALGLTILPYFWQMWWFRALGVLAVLLALVGIYELRLASTRKLARLRLRIARDLHDEVGSNLGSIALLSEVMPKPAGGAAEEITEVRRIALQTINSLRDIVWFLDPASDSMEELLVRMRETAKTMLHGIAFEFSSTGNIAGVVPSLELRRNVLPVFKEMLHNVVKHAKATRVEIAVNVSSGTFELRLVDNGIGFDTSASTVGNGLKNLRRRAAEINGTLKIESQIGKGTKIMLSAPIT